MNPAQTNQPGLHRLSSGLTPDIVSNIPVHNPDAASMPVREDEELDKIMQDVGNELRKDDAQPAKKRFLLSKKAKKNADVKFSAQPIAPLPKPTPSLPPAAPKPVVQVVPKPKKQPQPVKVQAAPANRSPLPVFTIFVTVVVTVVLAAAAIAAYKK